MVDARLVQLASVSQKNNSQSLKMLSQNKTRYSGVSAKKLSKAMHHCYADPLNISVFSSCSLHLEYRVQKRPSLIRRSTQISNLIQKYDDNG